MKTLSLLLLLFVLGAAIAAAPRAFGEPPFASSPDLTCVGCASDGHTSFGYNTYAGERALVTTAQLEQKKETAQREYLTSNQAPKDQALAINLAALAKQRANEEKIVGKIEIKTVTPPDKTK